MLKYTLSISILSRREKYKCIVTLNMDLTFLQLRELQYSMEGII